MHCLPGTGTGSWGDSAKCGLAGMAPVAPQVATLADAKITARTLVDNRLTTRYNDAAALRSDNFILDTIVCPALPFLFLFFFFVFNSCYWGRAQ